MPARDLTDDEGATAVLVLTLAALLLRSAAAWLTIDVPGDGVSRALDAYDWSRSPTLVWGGGWLPGFTYLAGTVSFAIPDPMIAPRLVNVILGTASVPLLYAGARRIAGHAAALAAAVILAVLPLHVGLSASSLTEAGFVFAMLGVLCAILQSSAQTWSSVYLSDVLLAPAGVAASAFVVYMAAMVVGRLTNDRWVDRWGSIAVVRGGAFIGVAGIVLAMAASPLDAVAVAFLGFALVGLGSSSMFPVMVGAAGSRPGIPAGHGIAICTWLVRSGLVFAPALAVWAPTPR